MKKLLSHLFCSLALILVLSSCTTSPTSTANVDVISSNLSQNNLYLTHLTATIENKVLTISGGVRTKTIPTFVAPGYIEIEVYTKENILIKTLETLYSPSILHVRPKVRRTGYFSATVSDVEPQPLLLKVFYRRKVKNFP